MRKVQPFPTEATLALLREYSEACNQAATGLLHPFVAVTGTYTAGLGDIVIHVAPTGACTITLPPPADTVGSIRWVKRTNNTVHTVTIQPASGNVDGAASVTLTAAYQARAFHSDGSNYWTV